MVLALIICTLLIAADQIIKLLITRNLAPNGVMDVIPGIVEFRYYENDGAAFSILAGKQGLLIVVTGLALLCGLAYVLFFRKPKNLLEYTTFILIFSGGVGNLVDRITNGYVVDYISLLFMRFAIFNLADCFVCVGFGLLIIAFIRSELQLKKAEEGQKKQDAPSGETGQKAKQADGED